MSKIRNKQINFSLLYGIVLKKRHNYLIIDYYHGKIKVLLDEINETIEIQEGYTISVSGYLKQDFIKTKLIAQQISIFDKKPHRIEL